MSDNRCIRDNKLAVLYCFSRRADFNDLFSSLHSDKFIVEAVELIHQYRYQSVLTRSQLINEQVKKINKYIRDKVGFEANDSELRELEIIWVPLGKYYKVITEYNVEIFDEDDSEWILAK